MYKISEEAIQKLKALVEEAINAVQKPLEGTEKLVSDIYTGRDPLGGSLRMILGDGGMPLNTIVDAERIGSWRPPETTANLFLSRIRQIVTALTPGVPSIDSRPRIAGAAKLAEYQNEITEWVSDHGDLEEAMRRCAFLGLLSPYVGCKLVIDKSKYTTEKVKFLAVEPGDCGYEPFHRRFKWHTYQKQWGDLPKHWKITTEGEEELNPWDICQVTEVYHEGFRFGSDKMGDYPMSIFVQSNGEDTNALGRTRKGSNGGLGNYVTTEDTKVCPLEIVSFLDPAPKEDVAPAEVLSWIPIMRMIVQVLVQINREISTVNKVVLYDKEAISDDVVSIIQQATPGATVFAPVDVDDATRGVNATMRPVEQASVLNEYLASLQTYMSLFDDVTGVSPTDRGAAQNPRKSATEASSIVNSGNRRNRDRLEVLANLWASMARIHHKNQRSIYGKQVEIPLSNGLVHTIPVPDPKTAEFAFRVDAVELGHLSRRGDVETQMNWLTTVTNVMQTFQNAAPRIVRETLRQLGKAMGITDVDLYLDAPVIEAGPEDRYIAHLQTGNAIPVYQEDQHQMYIAYYGKILQKAVATGNAGASVMALEDAIEQHNVFVQQAAAANIQQGGGSPVPGMGGEGPDNQIAAQLAAGQNPGVTAQTLG